MFGNVWVSIGLSGVYFCDFLENSWVLAMTSVKGTRRLNILYIIMFHNGNGTILILACFAPSFGGLQNEPFSPREGYHGPGLVAEAS
jgi:hypothetical protein